MSDNPFYLTAFAQIGSIVLQGQNSFAVPAILPVIPDSAEKAACLSPGARLSTSL